jgi:uncharacterized protein (TIGR02246 family)
MAVRASIGAGTVVYDAPMPSCEDLEAIRKLLARYCFAIDARDAEAWAGLFTEEGVFHYTPGDPIIGRAALRQFVSMIPDDRHHLTMNEVIDIDGDSATVRAYTLVTRGTPPIISAVGTYHDSLTRTADGWRFSLRLYTPDSSA